MDILSINALSKHMPNQDKVPLPQPNILFVPKVIIKQQVPTYYPQATSSISPNLPHHTVFASTGDKPVNRHANSHTLAANVADQDILLSNANPLPVQHSDLKPPRPLPSYVTTPVNIDNFTDALANYRDQNMALYLIDGLINGFDIGYHWSPARLNCLAII